MRSRAGNVRERWRDLQRKLHLTRTGQVAVVAAVVPWLVAYLVAGKALYIFAYGTLLLVVASYLLAPRGLKLEAERAGLRPRAQQGDRLEVEARADREPRRFDLRSRGAGAGASRDDGEGSRAPSRRAATRSCTGTASVVPAPRRLHGRPARRGDERPARAHRTRDGARRRVRAARPPTHRARRRPSADPPLRGSADPSAGLASRGRPGLEFYGMREYVPGDDLRRIVWRASARTGKLMVREAEEGITDRIMIIVDTDRGSHSWDGDHSESFETGVRAAASLAVRHLRDGYEVRNESNAGALTRALRGAGTAARASRRVRARRPVDASRCPRSSGDSSRDPRRDAHNILITPNLDERTAAQLRLVLNKGVSMMVVGLIWDERGDAARRACRGARLPGRRRAVPGRTSRARSAHDIGAGQPLDVHDTRAISTQPRSRRSHPPTRRGSGPAADH